MNHWSAVYGSVYAMNSFLFCSSVIWQNVLPSSDMLCSSHSIGKIQFGHGTILFLSHSCGLLLQEHLSTCTCAHAEANPGFFFFTKRSAWGWRKILEEGVENAMNKMGEA